MVLNYIWIGFFVVAFIIALVKVIFLGDTEIFTAIMNATFDSSKTAFTGVTKDGSHSLMFQGAHQSLCTCY